jgi:hypothetical protein
MPEHTTYLCSVQMGEAGSGTATATASNVPGGPVNYIVTATGNFTVTYRPCLPAAPNTVIPVATAANASATAVAVTLPAFRGEIMSDDFGSAPSPSPAPAG